MQHLYYKEHIPFGIGIYHFEGLYCNGKSLGKSFLMQSNLETVFKC